MAPHMTMFERVHRKNPTHYPTSSGQLRAVLKKSRYIKKAQKEKRFTKEHSVSQTAVLIVELDRATAELGGSRRASVLQSNRSFKKILLRPLSCTVINEEYILAIIVSHCFSKPCVGL